MSETDPNIELNDVNLLEGETKDVEPENPLAGGEDDPLSSKSELRNRTSQEGEGDEEAPEPEEPAKPRRKKKKSLLAWCGFGTHRTVESKAFIAIAVVGQLLFLVLFAVFTEHSTDAEIDNSSTDTTVATYYHYFQHVQVMILIGFGYLMTFLRRYSYSALCFNMLITCWTAQWSILCMGFFHNVHHSFEHVRITLSIEWLIEGMFGAGCVLISFGAVLGKTSPSQLLVMALVEIPVYALNFYIGSLTLKAVDVGGSMFVHTAGSIFGMMCSWILTQKKHIDEDGKVGGEFQSSRYSSDLFSMIGSIFLFMYWPSFNGALAPQNQHRIVLNTHLALIGSAMTAFITSRLLRGRFEMEDIQNATLAGGVAIGSSSDLVLPPGASLGVGLFAGFVSVVGYWKVSPLLQKYLRLHDTCGVTNLHFLPGLIGGIGGAGSALYASLMSERGHKIYGEDLSNVFEHGDVQVWFQLAALAITVAIMGIGGLVCGLLLRWLFPPMRSYQDEVFFEMPEDYYTKDGEEVPDSETETETDTSDELEPLIKKSRFDSLEAVFSHLNISETYLENLKAAEIYSPEDLAYLDQDEWSTLITKSVPRNKLRNFASTL